MKRIIISLLLSVVVWGVAQSQTTEPTLRKIYVSSELGYPLAPASSKDGTLHTGVLSMGSVDINALLPKYKIGGVPAQQIWNDKDFFGFYVSTDTLDLSGAALSYTVDGFPEDRISFDAKTGKFLFYPNATDIAGFTLTLIADAGDDYIVSQKVQFGVEPEKGNMFSYLSDESRDMPDPDDYFTITSLKGGSEIMNGESRANVMHYSVSGVEVVLNAEDESNKLNMLYSMMNLKELNIYAEKVIVESPVSFHSTNVTIYADEIIFRNGASLRTTSVNHGSAEKLCSGNVNLYVRELTNETSGPLFYMNAEATKGKMTFSIPGVYHTARAGEYVNQPYAWLHPNWLMPVVSMLNDAYIDQQTGNVQTYCDYYIKKIESYRNSEYWKNSDIESLELEALASEMRSMVSKIRQKFDYFGNPQGFMPMLSFEVNQTLYKQEIDRSIRTLYFTYWMKNADKTIAQRIAACKQAIVQEKEQLTTNIKLAGDLAVSSNNLQNEMIELVSEMDILTDELDKKTDELIQQAEGNVARYNQLNLAKKIVAPCIKVVGIVGGAVVGAYTGNEKAAEMGKKAGEIGAQVSDKIFDFVNPPLDQKYADNPPYAEFYNTLKSDATNFGESVSSFSNTLKNVNQDDLGTRDGVLQIGESLYDSSESMMVTISKFDNAVSKTSITNEQIQTELNKLIAESPEYSELVDKVNALNQKKENTVLEMYSVFNQLINTTYEIQKGVVTIDALNVAAFGEDLKKDFKTMLFVDGMERNAKNRLLESHYYMGRSYEYSFLEAYKISLNTEKLFNKCAEIAKNAQNSNLTESDFNNLKQVYTEDLATVEKKIIDTFRDNNVPQQKSIYYTLSQEQLDMINSNTSNISINLFEDGKFPLYEADLRILDINIELSEFEITGSNPDSDRYFDLNIVHEGNSRFIKNGKVLGFAHKNKENVQPMKWAYRCYQGKDPIKEKMSPSSLSLLNSLLENVVTEETVFAKPAAWGYLTFERSNEYNAEEMAINVKKLQLKIDYEAISESTYPVAFVATDKGLNPNIQLIVNDVPTVMASGFYAHIFNNKQSRLQLIAPQRFGEWQFEKWVDQNSKVLSSNNIYNAGVVNSNKYIKAAYKKTPAVLEVEASFDVPKEKGYLQIKVENTGSQNLEWKASKDESLWLAIKAGGTGVNEGYITVELDENSEYDRAGIIKVLSNAGDKEVKIMQRGEKGSSIEENSAKGRDHITIYMRENGLCYVDLGWQASSINVELYDMNGRTVKQLSVQDTRTFDIDMSNLSQGTYVIKMKSDEKEYYRKVMRY